MDVQETERMARLVQERRDILAEILRVSLRQESTIGSGLVEPLLEILREKDRLVDRLREVQQHLQPMAEVPAERRQWRDDQSRQQCRRHIDESAKLQQAILEIDSRCEQAMVHRRDELFDSLRHTSGAADASRAYASAARRTGVSAAGGSFDLTSG